MSGHGNELSDHVTCPRCGGSGEIERPVCKISGCGQKMIPRLQGNGWECPIHAGGMLI